MLTNRAKRWLWRQKEARVLHVFDGACNLINAEGQIVSLVKAELGPGPFAVVVAFTPSFTRYVDVDTPVLVEQGALRLGSLNFETAGATLWQPRPAWAKHRERPELLPTLLPTLLPAIAAGASTPANVLARSVGRAGYQRFAAAADLLIQGIAAQDGDVCRRGAARLAGLGPGLTPSGDDFLVGVIYSLWATLPLLVARELVQPMVKVAVPRTTSLSAAWLEAAGRGEAVEPWHALMQAVGENDAGLVAGAVQRILNIGHSSGADALAGFRAGLSGGTGR